MLHRSENCLDTFSVLIISAIPIALVKTGMYIIMYERQSRMCDFIQNNLIAFPTAKKGILDCLKAHGN